jgi:hypothetical protein
MHTLTHKTEHVRHQHLADWPRQAWRGLSRSASAGPAAPRLEACMSPCDISMVEPGVLGPLHAYPLQPYPALDSKYTALEGALALTDKGATPLSPPCGEAHQ